MEPFSEEQLDQPVAPEVTLAEKPEVANKFPEWPSEPDGTYGMDLFIGDLDYIGKGYGSQIVAQFVHELFTLPDVMRVIINPDIDNIAAIKAYERAGFSRIEIISRPSETEILMEIKRPLSTMKK